MNVLLTLIDGRTSNPASTFPDMPPARFWSSSRTCESGGFAVECPIPDDDESGSMPAWGIDFSDGAGCLSRDTVLKYVRCVRNENCHRPATGGMTIERIDEKSVEFERATPEDWNKILEVLSTLVGGPLHVTLNGSARCFDSDRELAWWIAGVQAARVLSEPPG